MEFSSKTSIGKKQTETEHTSDTTNHLPIRIPNNNMPLCCIAIVTHQTISPESLVVKSNTKATMDRDELMEQLKQLLEKKLPTIGNIQECQPYMQLKCILSKACKLDWSLEQDSPELR